MWPKSGKYLCLFLLFLYFATSNFVINFPRYNELYSMSYTSVVNTDLTWKIGSVFSNFVDPDPHR